MDEKMMKEMYQMMKEIHSKIVPSNDMSDEDFMKMDENKQRAIMEKEVVGKGTPEAVKE